jgi:hypothetical protein
MLNGPGIDNWKRRVLRIGRTACGRSQDPGDQVTIQASSADHDNMLTPS